MNRLKEYWVETVIVAIGVITGLIQLLFVKDPNLAALVIVISFLLSAASLSIRRDLSAKVLQANPLVMLINKIPSDRWRTLAIDRFRQLYDELQQWCKGQRNIAGGELISYQIKMLSSAYGHVRAVHLALQQNMLSLWDPDRKHGAFHSIIKAHAGLPDHVIKQRVFVCDKDGVLSKDGFLQDKLLKGILEHQINSQPKGGLGYDVKVAWIDVLRRNEIAVPQDMLIVDNLEAIVIKGRTEDHTHAEASVDANRVQGLIRDYNKLWEIAEPAVELLKNS